MKRKLLLCFVMLFALALNESRAQERKVAGKVTSIEDGATLPGVNVLIKGSANGTITDGNGAYSLSVNDDDVLVFSFVGYKTDNVPVGNRSVIDWQMATDATQLGEVVVTALGISRKKASLGYAQQSVTAEDLNRFKTDNVISTLSGKVAGVNVRTNQTMGGSAVINIRGNSSFTNNNPLFIVDGIPVSNTTKNTRKQSKGRRGYDYGNPAADINPEDIESMSVLKGAAATAIYGSRGQNGVILVTTKKGGSIRKGIGIDYSTGVTIGKIDRSTFADYQSEFGAGYYRNYGDKSPNRSLEDYDSNGDKTKDSYLVPTRLDGSYGDPLDGSLIAYQWDSFVPGEPNFGKAYPYVAGKNDPHTFFESQVIVNNSLALSGGNDKNTFRLSYTNLSQDDIMPNSELKKHTVSFNGSTRLNDKLSTDVMFQYNKNNAIGRFSTGYGDNLMSQFRQWWQVNVDMKQLERVYNRTGLNYSWNMKDVKKPLTPIYWDNPYWTRYKNFNSDTRDRILSKIGIQYKLNDWISVSGRVSIDNYTEVREERRAVGSVATEFGAANGGLGADEPSGYEKTNIENTEWNYNGMVNVSKQINDDFSLASLLGFNLRKERYEYVRASTSGGLAVPGLYALSNSVGNNPFPVEILWEKEVYGYFANVNLGFRNYLYLDANYRIDVTSALPVENNQYSYNSLGLGFVFSELMDVSWIDFGKARVSYGTVGNDTRALRVQDTYVRRDNFRNTKFIRLSRNKNNSELKPEKTTEIEFGVEGTFLDKRLSIDIGYFSKETTDQLLSIGTSSTTGFTRRFINAGTISVKGFEAVIGGDIVKTNEFTYNLTANFTKIKSNVENLKDKNGKQPKNYQLKSFQGGVSTNATVGQPMGVLRGTGYTYLKGRRVVNENGYYKPNKDQIIGDPNPEWTLGLNNSLSFKGFKLGFLVDISKGGDVFSLDMNYGQGAGLYPHTAGLNELGNSIRDNVADGGGVLNKGVLEDGSENTKRVEANQSNKAFSWKNPSIMTVYDASYVKLRELSLTYSLPSGLIGAWSHGINISIVGRNLWIIHKNVPFSDPEAGLGGQFSAGYLSGAYPAVRSVGFKIDLKF